MRFFIVTIICFWSASAAANGMINNTAKAYVDGNIIQQADKGATNTINIGSIVASSAKNVKVRAYVEGDVIVKTSKGKSTALNIGSYGGRK